MNLLSLRKLRVTWYLSAVIHVDDLSAFVTEWRRTNCEWSKIITTEDYMKC